MFSNRNSFVEALAMSTPLSLMLDDKDDFLYVRLREKETLNDFSLRYRGLRGREPNYTEKEIALNTLMIKYEKLTCKL